MSCTHLHLRRGLGSCAWSVYALIFGRIVQSLGLSAAGVVGAGSLADVYPPAIRGNAMVRSVFTAPPPGAPVIRVSQSRVVIPGMVHGHRFDGHRHRSGSGRYVLQPPPPPPPPCALFLIKPAWLCARLGFVGEFFGWRAIFWSLAIAAATLIVVVRRSSLTTSLYLGTLWIAHRLAHDGGVQIFFFLPETLNKSGPKRSANPIHTLKFFLHPPLLVLVQNRARARLAPSLAAFTVSRTYYSHPVANRSSS